MSRARTFIVTVLALAAFAGTVMLLKDRDLALPVPSQDAPRSDAAPGLPETRTGTLPLFTGVAELLERVTPAVVNIQVRAEAEAADLPPLLQDPTFRRFFGVPDQLPRQERASAGSGVVVDAARGYVLTNFHVVNEATDIAVTLKDCRTFTATVVGKDQATDLALLKIDAPDLTALPVSDMSDTRVIWGIGTIRQYGSTRSGAGKSAS